MATTEERLAALDATLAQMNERLNDMRAWLMALTWLMGAQFAAIVALAILVARR